MKTIILSISLLVSLGFNLYLLNAPHVVEGSLDEDIKSSHDEVKLAQSAIKKINHQKTEDKNLKEYEKRVDSSVIINDKTPVEDLREISAGQAAEIYQISKDLWREKVSEFYEFKLNLSPSEIQAYFDLLNEKTMAISDYLSKFRDDEDPSKMIMLTPEQNIEISKLEIKYSKKLQKMFGNELYKEHLKFKKSYNEKASVRAKKSPTYFMEL